MPAGISPVHASRAPCGAHARTGEELEVVASCPCAAGTETVPAQARAFCDRTLQLAPSADCRLDGVIPSERGASWGSAMGFRFYRRSNLGDGLGLNLSKLGIGASFRGKPRTMWKPGMSALSRGRTLGGAGDLWCLSGVGEGRAASGHKRFSMFTEGWPVQMPHISSSQDGVTISLGWLVDAPVPARSAP